MYIARVKAKHKEAVLMYSCYVAVVFNFVAKAMHYPNLVPVLDIYPYILFHFKNVFFIIGLSELITKLICTCTFMFTVIHVHVGILMCSV